MAFWDGKERSPATWKALRVEIAGFLMEAASDTTWQIIYDSIGESMRPGATMTSLACALNTDEPPNIQVLSDEATVPESTSLESRLDSATRYFLGLASTRDVDVVSRILRSLNAAEKQALVFAHMSAQADEVVLAPALAGRSGSGRRYRSWPLVVRRAHASRFHQWCQSRDVNILQNRLPYGIMKEFWG
jgi:hypothetical protein